MGMGCLANKSQISKSPNGSTCYQIQQLSYQSGKVINNLLPILLKGNHPIGQLLHRSIVRIKFYLQGMNKVKYGSGVLISNNLVLTSAQNLYNRSITYQYQQRMFRVGLGTTEMAEEDYEVEDWRYLDQYITCPDEKSLYFDYALIKLKKRQSSIIGFDRFLEVSLPCKCLLSKRRIMKLEVCGFSSQSKGKQTLKYGQAMNDSILDIQPQRNAIKYVISTLEGQLGCPIVVNERIIAIHIGGSKTEKANIGRLVTKDMIQTIKKWSKQLNGGQLTFNESNECPRCLKLQSQVPKIDKKPAIIQSLAIWSNINGKNCIEVARNLQSLGNVLKEQGKFAQALRKYTRCLEVYKVIQSHSSLEKAKMHNQIGFMHYELKNESEALKNYQKSLEIYNKVVKQETLGIAEVLNNIGLAYLSRKKYEKALFYLNKSFEIRQKLKGRISIQVAEAFHNIGRVHASQNNLDQALKFYYMVLEVYQKIQGKGSIDSAKILSKIGLAHQNACNNENALETYTMALEIYQKVYRKGNIALANILYNIGLLYYNSGNHYKALQNFFQALQIKQRLKGEENVECAELLHDIGLVYVKQKNYAHAVKYYLMSLKIKGKMNETGWIEPTTPRNSLGCVYSIKEDYSTACDYYLRALEIIQSNHKQGSLEQAQTCYNIGSSFYNQKFYLSAIGYYQSSISQYKKLQGKSQGYANAQFSLGMVYYDQKSYGEAKLALKQSLTCYQKLNLNELAKKSAHWLARTLKELNELNQLAEIVKKYELDLQNN